MTTFVYRADARSALKRAEAHLASEDPIRLKYAAFELRTVIESLTYDRALAYRAELPPGEYKDWQPRKLMQALLEIEPYADKGSTVSFGDPITEQGMPDIQRMQTLGSETVFDLAAIKRHYDALGSFLHSPTPFQLENKGPPDPKKLRNRCDDIAKLAAAALASTVYNVTLGTFAKFECGRCKNAVRRRLPISNTSVDAECFSCGATFTITYDSTGVFRAKPHGAEFECPTSGCPAKPFLYAADVRLGASWNCDQCGQRYKLVFGAVNVPDASARP